MEHEDGAVFSAILLSLLVHTAVNKTCATETGTLEEINRMVYASSPLNLEKTKK